MNNDSKHFKTVNINNLKYIYANEDFLTQTKKVENSPDIPELTDVFPKQHCFLISRKSCVTQLLDFFEVMT